jgi:hypothetical protein
MTDARLEGVVLCRVGAHRMAFEAPGVHTILAPGDMPGAAHARDLFGLARLEGRLLREGDAALVVDSVEISQETPALRAVPAPLQGAAGGSLLGFLELSELWPLFSLRALARFAASRSSDG